MSSNYPCIISIEGNIGSGKSTLVETLRTRLPSLSDRTIITLQEPVAEWEAIQDSAGESMLTKFYRDQTTYAFPFQMMAYISRLASVRRAIRNNPTAIFITERSVHTDRYVFAQMLRDEGKIGEVEHQIYLHWFDEFIQDIPIAATVYVKAAPQTCESRIQTRNRTGETIPLSYLQRCNDYHESWLSKELTGPSSLCPSTPLLTLDADQEMCDWLADNWVAQIHDFLTGILSSPKESGQHTPPTVCNIV